MSVIGSTIAAPVVYLPRATAKLFEGSKLEAITGQLIPFEASEAVKPSHIHMTKASALASMGAKATPVSFINGLLYLTTAYAWGQGKLDVLSKDLPAIAAFALARACEHIKGGAGINAGMLRHAIGHAMAVTLALPGKPKSEKASEAPAIAGQSSRIADDTAGAPASAPAPVVDLWANVRTREEEHVRQWAEYGDSMAGEFKERANLPVPTFARMLANDREGALAMLRTMATMAGFDLIAHIETAAPVEPAAPVKVRKPRAKKAA